MAQWASFNHRISLSQGATEWGLQTPAGQNYRGKTTGAKPLPGFLNPLVLVASIAPTGRMCWFLGWQDLPSRGRREW